MRKTVSVEDLKKVTNEILAVSTVDPAMRKGWQAAMEWVLHETGNYRGFRHLAQHEVPKGHLPGIRIGPNGEMLPPECRFVGTDDTRVSYV